MEVFSDYAYYYNAFYANKDYEGEAHIVDSLLKKYGRNIHKIINYGCGTGKHDAVLSGMGYECTGVDMSSLMIEIAKNSVSEKERNSFFVADIREYEPLERYDAVVSLFHVISYQNSDEDVKKAFTSARKALNPGGVFLFDVWYGPGVLSDQPVVRVREVEDHDNRMIRIARPVMYDKRNVVDVCYEVLVINKETSVVREIREVHSMRYFFKTELEAFLKSCGFELIDNIDCNTLSATDYQSWTSYFIARAI